MRLRIASLAFLLGAASTGIGWLTLQPTLLSLLSDVHRRGDVALVQRIRAALPFHLALDLLVVTALTFVVLWVVVGLPLRRTETAIEQLTKLEQEVSVPPRGGLVLSRLQRALRQLSEALRAEQALTQRQMAELRAKNEALAQAQTELVAAERLAAVGRLAAGVAHEVGNPLSGILGYLSLVRSRAEGQWPVIECVEHIEAEVRRINGIVQGLLDLGRPDRGERGPVAVREVALATVRLLKATPELASVEVTTDIAEGTVARAEPGPLSQILLNLLLNAAQALGGSGKIHLAASRSDALVTITVDDEGPGIAPEVLPRVFEPFFTTKQAGKGTGLGLAVSHHLAGRMGGSLTAENLPGRGARFTLQLEAVALPGT